MIKIVVCGICGRMGKEIVQLVESLDDIMIVGGVEVSGHKEIGKSIHNINIYDELAEIIGEADCVVEFTNPSATIEHLSNSGQFKKPYVIGTTGFSEEEIDRIKSYSKEFPIFLAPNMSRGVNHLYNLIRLTSRVLRDYDIEVVETHHRNKKDAPSGTAKEIVRVIESVRPDTRFVYGREGMVDKRKKDEVCINSVRGGDVAGEHRVLFLGDGEFIELRHYATSRRCFAAGAVDAVRFIVDKGPGLYTMQQLLPQGQISTMDK